MKKLILCSVAFAAMTGTAVSADLRAPAPVYKAPAPVVAPMSDWTGVYIGISGGYAFGRSEFDPTGSLTGAPSQTMDHDGGLFGGQIGFNYQLPSRLVIGAVADGSWAGLKGNICVDASGSCTGGAGDSYAHAKVTWLATFRGNLGFTPSNDVLAYVTGGLAVAGIEGRITNFGGAGDPDITAKETRTGWTAGGGLKYRMARSWSVGAEYLYVDLGKHGYTFTSAGHPASELISADVKTHLNVIRASLSYEFGGANSISTRY